MKLIRIFTHDEILAEEHTSQSSSQHLPYEYPEMPFFTRQAARAVLMNEKDEVALINIKKEGILETPGGQLEAGETTRMAVLREVLEETGFDATIVGEIGIVALIAHDPNFNEAIINISFNYLLKTVGSKKDVNYTTNELNNQTECIWVAKDQAANAIHNALMNNPNNYAFKFTAKRDILLLSNATRLH